MTTFENGKKYDFTLNAKENGFAINRESGKLLFTITDPTTGHVYRVRPREFQKRHIPETLHCIYHNGFEQDFAAIYAEIYEPGQEYDFRVINVTGEGLYTLQDDANGISLQNVKLNAKLTRFQRIKCKVAKINGAYVRLKYVSQDKKPAKNSSALTILYRSHRPRNSAVAVICSPVFCRTTPTAFRDVCSTAKTLNGL